jgi:hypothetical protein
VTHELDAGLERRLRELAATGTPDWLDVRRRAQRPAPARPSWRLAAAIAAAIALLVLAAVATGVGSRVAEWLSLSESEEPIPGHTGVAHVTRDRLYLPGRAPIQLAAPLLAPELGMDRPLAVPSPDGRYVAYHAAPDGRPALRIVDTRTGEDRLLSLGAQSVAWGERIAFVRGRQVVVADRPAGQAEPWTSARTPAPGDYRVAAWAGQVLLVEAAQTEVRALDGPGESRPLSIDNLAAVSPDGRGAIGTYLPGLYQDSPSSIVHVDDVRTGRTIASIDLMRAVGEDVPRRWVRGGIWAAAWRGDTIVGTSNAGAVSTLVVLRFDGQRLRLERVLRLDEAARAGGRGTLFFGNPVFTGAGTRHVLVQLRGPLGGRGYLVASVSCDLARSTCTQGRRVRHRAWSAIVDNPSRPLR